MSQTEGSASSLFGPVTETLAVMTVVSLVAWSPIPGIRRAMVLAAPVGEPPWALVSSVYAHATVPHLLNNAVLVALAGTLVAWTTTRLRFHAFFLGTGVLAGVAQVWVGSVVGPAVGVLGASGAAFALVGYVLTGNAASETVLGVLPARATVVVVAAVAVGLTLALSGPNSALVAHLVGALAGLAAGRVRLLRAD